MDSVKNFFASKTIWGALTALASISPSLLALIGYNVTPEDASGAIAAIQAIGVSLGSLVAIYGRVVATKKIG